MNNSITFSSVTHHKVISKPILKRDKSYKNKSISLFSANVRSLKNKLSEFKTYLIYDKIGIFFISETHLNNDFLDSLISKSHKIYRNDRNQFGGGVMIGVKNEFNSHQISNISSKSFESIFCVLNCFNQKFILCCVYITPCPTLVQLYELENLLKTIDNEYNDFKLIMTGDFNIHFEDNHNYLTKYLNFILESLKLYQSVSDFTYPSQSTYSTIPSIIDLLITNDKKLFEKIIVRDNISEKCDHLLIYTEIKFSKSNNKISNVDYILDINDKSLCAFNNCLSNLNFENIFENCNDINVMYDSVCDKIMSIFNQSFKYRKVKVKNRTFPTDIKKLLALKRKINKYNMNSDNTLSDYSKFLYRLIRDKINQNEKKEFQKLIEKSGDFSKLYRNIKSFFKPIDRKITLKDNDLILTEEKTICEHFAEYFSSNFTKNDSNSANFSNSFSNEFSSNRSYLNEFRIEMTDILREIQKIDLNKSNGNSLIPLKVIKNCSENFAKFFYFLFNSILKFCIIPGKMKINTVFPVLKPNKPKYCVKSYRPISVCENFLKIFESLLYNKLNAFVTKNNLISDKQYGFKCGISTNHQIIDLIYELTSSFNDKCLDCIDIIFLDYSSAFDTVCHKKLLELLYDLGIRNENLKVLENSISFRKQTITRIRNYYFNTTSVDLI